MDITTYLWIAGGGLYFLIGLAFAHFVWVNTRGDEQFVPPGPMRWLFHAMQIGSALLWPLLAVAMVCSALSSIIGNRTGRYLPLNATEAERKRYDAYWARKRGEK